MYASREFAQLVERGPGMFNGIVEQHPVLAGALYLLACQLQSEQHRDQPLLGPVVKIARQLMTRRGSALQDPSLGRS